MKTIYIILLTLLFVNSNAQNRKPVTKDTLLYLFKRYPKFKAYDKIDNIDFYRINFDELRTDKELKEYFLSCLDQKEYFEYETQKRDSVFIKIINEDPERLRSGIISYLYERKRSKEIDSILKSPQLMAKFKDSVIVDRKSFYRRDKNIETYTPHLELLVKFHYPEVYTFIKNIYIKYGGETKLWYLLEFNDTEAQKEYDIKMRSGYLPTDFFTVRNLNTAYGLKIAKTFINIDKEIQFTSDDDDPLIPYNCLLGKTLLGIFKEEKIILSPVFEAEYYKIENSPNKKTNEDCFVLKKYAPN